MQSLNTIVWCAIHVTSRKDGGEIVWFRNKRVSRIPRDNGEGIYEETEISGKRWVGLNWNLFQRTHRPQIPLGRYLTWPFSMVGHGVTCGSCLRLIYLRKGSEYWHRTSSRRQISLNCYKFFRQFAKFRLCLWQPELSKLAVENRYKVGGKGNLPPLELRL